MLEVRKRKTVSKIVECCNVKCNLLITVLHSPDIVIFFSLRIGI